MRAPAGLRYACLGLVAALAAVTGLLVNPAPAAAFGSPTPVLVDPANWPAELSLIKGQADLPVVDNAPLQAEIEETVTAASRAGRLLPVLRAIGTVGAGTTALTVGYYVGGVLNHKFHLSCRISSSCDPPAAQLGTYTVRSTTTPMTWDLIAGDSSGYWTPNRPTGWLVRFNIAVPGTGGADMNQAGYNCSSPCYSYPDADAFLGTVSAGTKWTASGPENGGVIAVARIQTDEEMDHSYKSTLPEPYSSGPLDITIPPTTFDGSTTDPDSDSDIADAVRTVLTGASVPAQIEIAKTVDPDYEGPAYTMPDCYGLTVEGCQEAVTTAATAVGLGTIDFTVNTAANADPDVADSRVIGTTPGSTTETASTTVAIDRNPNSDEDPPRCDSTTENPHWSAAGGTIDAKARITCNYAGVADVAMELWKCSSSPSADYGSLSTGEWGCATAATTVKTIAVTPAVEKTVYVPDVGVSFVTGSAYYIATTQMPNAQQSWSQDGWFVTQP